MQIFGTKTCIHCRKKFDWTGTRDNNVNEDMQKQIRTNNDLTFARFMPVSENEYSVVAKCSNCGSNNKFTYVYDTVTY